MNSIKFIGPARFAALFAVLILAAAPCAGDEKRGEWFSFDPDRPAGSPVEAVVLSSTPERTELRISVPGVWLSSVTYGEETFSTVDFPEVQLGGAGFPEKEGERGWYDFPAESGHPPLHPERYRNALTSGVPRYRYPEEAMEDPPKTAEEMEKLGINPAGARPGIPALRGLLAVTEDSEPGKELSLSVEVEKETALDLPHRLMPAGFEGLDQKDEEGYTPPKLVDDAFYRNIGEPYQGVEDSLSATSRAGLFSLSEFRVPLATLTGPARLEIPVSFVITIDHLSGPVDFDCPLSWDSWIFKSPFINGDGLRESLTASGQKILASRSARYLIVTPKDYHAELMPLAFWKNSKGLAVDFAFVGDDMAADREAIDAYLEDYFRKHYCHGVYVLLVGDHETIPSGRSDFINADPDFDRGDSDHVYEVLGDDRFASLYVGRLAVASDEELELQLAKILQYEKSPPGGDWPLQVTLAANSENDDNTRGVSDSFPSKYAGAVNEAAGYASYSPTPNFEVLHAGASNESDTRATNDDVIDAVNSGRGHLLYRGHGIDTAWVQGWDGSSQSGSSFTAGTHLPLLENRVLPIVYSIACRNSRMRAPGYIANEWMNRETGAVAHWGATVNSYTSENHERAKGVFRAIFESGFNRLGPMLGEAEQISHTATGGGSAWDNNTFAYLLHGCPELTIRKNRVVSSALEMGYDFTEVGIRLRLSDGKTDEEIPAALVNLELKDGSTLNGFTGTDGELLLDLDKSQRDAITAIQVHAGGYGFGEEGLQPRQETEVRIKSFDAKGGTTISIQGRFDEYLIQYSDDLETWHDLDEVIAENEITEIIDADAAERPRRFYRVVPLL